MIIERRRLNACDVDHEVLWSSVLLVGAAASWWMVRTVGIPLLSCPFKAITGLPCLTCGAGRAALALASGEVQAALRLNPLVPLGAIAAASYVLYTAVVLGAGRERLRIRLREEETGLLRGVSVAFAAAVWLWLVADGR